ncbi:MAG: hypothetical protein HY392_01610 [Candidatus Diapherotrites archaeon]|nr:hypothetical protein [Candidatus Diapherotrites archaeon]
MELDIVQAVKGSFSWLSDGKTWKYVLLQYAFTFLSLLVFGGLAVLVLGPAIISLFTGQAAEGLVETIVSGIIALFLIFIVWIIAATVFSLAITVLVVNRGLELFGFRPSGGFSFGKAGKILVLGIVSFIYQVFSWYSKKLMAVVLVFYLLAFLAIATALFAPLVSFIFILLTLALAIPYIAIMIYNGLRLALSIPVMLEGDTSVTQSLSKSWNMTNGHALMLFFTWVVFVIAIIAISIIAGLAADIFSTLLGLASPSIAPAIKIGANMLVNFIINPIIMVAGLFLVVGIFAQLSGNSMGGEKMAPFREQPQFTAKASAQPSPQRPRWLAEKK